AKAIVEVRVSILDADEHVKPEMTASVTFQEARSAATSESRAEAAAPVVVVPKRAVVEQNGEKVVWVVNGSAAARRVVTLGRERLDQVEVMRGVVPGEAVILGPPPSLPDRAQVRVKGK